MMTTSFRSMMTSALGVLLLAVLFAAGTSTVVGCSGGDGAADAKDSGHDTDSHDTDGHNHSDTDGHDHSDTDGHNHSEHDPHEGEPMALGTQEAGGMQVSVTQYGHLMAGHELALDVTVSGGDVEDLRVWFGGSDSTAHRPGHVDRTDSGWHAHLDPMTSLPEGGKVQVEVTTADGVQVVAFDAHIEDHDHGDHDDHDHDHDHDDEHDHDHESEGSMD